MMAMTTSSSIKVNPAQREISRCWKLSLLSDFGFTPNAQENSGKRDRKYSNERPVRGRLDDFRGEGPRASTGHGSQEQANH